MFDAKLIEAKKLIVGLGSMGKRRIRNLDQLGLKNIHGHDIRPDRNQEAGDTYGILTYTTFEDAVSQPPAILIISTPPDEHTQFALWAAGNRTPFFIEASVVSDDLPKIIQLSRSNDVIGVPSCTPRFHPSIQTMKDIIDSKELGKLLSFSHHYGSCYANWHPWEDYRDVYFSKKDTGAGRESVPFEIEWLEWLFGEFFEVNCYSDKRLDLDPAIIDTYQIITRGQGGVLGNLMIEVTSPYYFRITKAIFSDGVLIWDWRQKKVVTFDREGNLLKEYPEPEPVLAEGYKFEENMYIEEMRYFFEVLEGKRAIAYTLEEDLRILKILDSVEWSSTERKSVRIAE